MLKSEQALRASWMIKLDAYAGRVSKGASLKALMKLAIAASIFMANFDSTALAAQDVSKEQFLYDQCVRDDPICAFFLMGIAKVMVTLGKAYKDPALEGDFIVSGFSAFAICSKSSPVNGHVLRHVYLAWLDLHPEHKQDPVGQAAMDAFREAWPCDEPK
jgi:hypothetical protein